MGQTKLHYLITFERNWATVSCRRTNLFIKVAFCPLNLYLLSLRKRRLKLWSRYWKCSDEGWFGQSSFVFKDSVAWRRFYFYTELTFVILVHQLNQVHLVQPLMPEMMYDLMLLQHNKVILNWLHNATKMPCQYILPLPIKQSASFALLDSEGGISNIFWQSIDFTYHLCLHSINTGLIMQAKHCSAQMYRWSTKWTRRMMLFSQTIDQSTLAAHFQEFNFPCNSGQVIF